MSLLFKHIETDMLLASINSINSFIQLKDKDVEATNYQVALLKIAYTALHELNCSMSGNTSSWTMNKMKESIEEMQKEIDKQNEDVLFAEWLRPGVRDAQSEKIDKEISILECFDLISGESYGIVESHGRGE